MISVLVFPGAGSTSTQTIYGPGIPVDAGLRGGRNEGGDEVVERLLDRRVADLPADHH